MSWTPTTLAELQQIVRDDLHQCNNEERAAFFDTKTVFEKVPILRCGRIDAVFRIAKHKDWLLIYDDIEHGFDWCRPDADGIIREYGCGQGGLQAAMYDYVHRVT